MDRLTSAVAISVLVSKYNLKLQKDEHTALLKSLLIHSDAASRSCPDYDELVKLFGDRK